MYYQQNLHGLWNDSVSPTEKAATVNKISEEERATLEVRMIIFFSLSS